MIFLLYYVFYVDYVVKKMIIVLVKYQFAIEIISAKTLKYRLSFSRAVPIGEDSNFNCDPLPIILIASFGTI